jgi:hypothetical protein
MQIIFSHPWPLEMCVCVCQREREDSVVCSQQCVPSTKFCPSPKSNAGDSLAILICGEREKEDCRLSVCQVVRKAWRTTWWK